MEKLFELTFQDQTLNPQIGTFTDASQATGTFTLEDGEYYLTNGDTKGFYAYAPIAIQPDSETDNKVTVEFDLKVVTASVNTHTIIGTYAGVDGSGIPTGAKITLQYNAGDIELVLGSGITETLIAAADVVVDQWYHFRIDCALDAPTESTYEVKIDGAAVTTVTGATTDYALGVISVLGTGLHACDECGIKNIRLITDDDYFVGRTALNQAFTDTKGYVDTHCMDLTSAQTAAGNKTFTGTTTTHGVIPATTDTYDIGSSAKEYNNAYIKALTINGTAAGDILTHNASEFVPRSGGTVITGPIFSRTVNDSEFRLDGGTMWGQGASLSLSGKDRPGSPALATLHTSDGTDTSDLLLGPNGIFALVTNGTSKYVAMQEDVIPRSGSNQISGSLIPSTDNSIDVGSSTKNIKMLYTKGITIDGAQFSPSDYVLPTGSYIQFAGSQAPAGFLVCNGGEISRTTYSALFAVIGTTYGSGDGSTTFNLPNLTDRFLQGSTTSGTVKNAGLPNIEGNTWNGNTGAGGPYFSFHSGPFGPSGGSMASVLSTPTNTTSDPNAVLRFDASTANPIYGNSTTVQPPALTCLICIKY